MKTVGKQLQEARLAKNWTPELAARETKIKVDRLRDLETDDYSHFTSPTYARGFVRTYARALGLDEYRILRQLDQKLPDDDSANIVTDTGVAYLPETAMPPRAAHRDYTGLYIVMGMGVVVTLAIVFVLFEAYRVGELSRVFGSGSETVATGSMTNAAPSVATTDAPLRAKPVDSDTPPPIVDATNAPAPVAVAVTPTPDTNTADAAPVAPRALPVDPSSVGTTTTSQDTPSVAPRALPVNPSDQTGTTAPAASPLTPPADTNTADAAPVAPRALPVDPSELSNAAPATTTVVLNNPPVAPAVTDTNADSTPPVVQPIPTPSSSARQSNSGPVVLPPADPAPTDSPAPDATTNATPQAAAPVAIPTATPADSGSDKRLVLTASEDSFVRVSSLDSPGGEQELYAAVLHTGQSIGFDGRKFSINVGNPSAVDIKLDGVNYGPHSDDDAPETFTVQSHLP